MTSNTRRHLIARPVVLATMLGLILAVSLLVSVTVGAADISPTAVAADLMAKLGLGGLELPGLQSVIIWELRAPRALGAAGVGAGLAICGVIMQATLHNPLADPYLLGLSSGASLGAVSVIVLGATVALPLAAFGGALAALAITLAIAAATGSLNPTRTILAGVAVSAALSALTSLVIFQSANNDSYREVLGWLLGSLGGLTWTKALVACGAAVVIGGALLLSANSLNAFSFGDRSATALGIPVTQVRLVLLTIAALLTGILVSVSGSIGFVGLVIPHAVRLLVGNRHQLLLPVAALAGAIVLVWADALSRTLFDPQEVPVGVITALVGAPLFAALLLGGRGRL